MASIHNALTSDWGVIPNAIEHLYSIPFASTYNYSNHRVNESDTSPAMNIGKLLLQGAFCGICLKKFSRRTFATINLIGIGAKLTHRLALTNDQKDHSNSKVADLTHQLAHITEQKDHSDKQVVDANERAEQLQQQLNNRKDPTKRTTVFMESFDMSMDVLQDLHDDTFILEWLVQTPEGRELKAHYESAKIFDHATKWEDANRRKCWQKIREFVGMYIKDEEVRPFFMDGINSFEKRVDREHTEALPPEKYEKLGTFFQILADRISAR